MKIKTKKRTHDYIAYMKGCPEKWEAGKTKDKAIEKLIKTRENEINEKQKGQ